MPVLLGPDTPLPTLFEADSNGLVAMGGNLSPDYLLSAYSKGLFPWNEGGMPPFWYSLDPRLILKPSQFKVSKSFRNLLNRQPFSISLNTSFSEVISNCAEVYRPGQDGTWLHQQLKESLTSLHLKGYAHSVEVRNDQGLVGGLYGIMIGKVFFGESMFSLVPNASKFALHKLCQNLPADALIDCQQETPHLLSLGAKTISRLEFEKLLSTLTSQSHTLAF